MTTCTKGGAVDTALLRSLSSQFQLNFYLFLLSQQNKGKKKKKGVIAGGGLKAQLRDDLDYAEFDGGYAQDYEDFM